MVEAIPLAKLMEGIEWIPAGGTLPGGLLVSGLAYDSRRVEPGSLFFAFTGTRADGRDFARQALERGALGVVSESPAPADFPGLWIQVRHGRRALARMSGRLYSAAAAAVTLIGATGTNGKTTTCLLIDAALQAWGRRTALIGTIAYHVAGRQKEAVNTTPESLDIYRLLEELRCAGGAHAVMEVSSHALALERVHGLRFDTALFTNLTRDHLDFHLTMENYFDAKSMLFDGRNGVPPRVAVLNADDEWILKLRPASGCEPIWYGFSDRAGLRALDYRCGFDGIRLELLWRGRQLQARSPLLGRFNAYNLMAAFAAVTAQGMDPEQAIAALSRVGHIPGRLERIDEGQPFLVLVDYAHTDDALRNVLSTLRGLNPRRLITVFGCGGDRDRKKRPLMGQAAGEGSDLVVLTSDNPRGEDPLSIMNDALVGLRRSDADYAMVVERERAIRFALEKAAEGDIVLIAGKGHETYQILGDTRIDFDDREVARRTLRALGFARRNA